MRRRWFLLLTLLLAIGGALVVLAQRPGPLRRALIQRFGPPAVESTEAHAARPDSPGFDHSQFDGLLADLVDAGGFVDYAGLARRREELRAYLADLATVDFDALDRDDKLALLINAYNAFTLELILDHYPLDSIRDIPSDRRWDAARWNIGGVVSSLNQLEHERIRPDFREPRIHFALVCAAVGCPPLRAGAYAGERLDAQLEDQMRRVHGDARWVRYEPGGDRIELSALYEWYAGDFEQVAGSVLDYVSRYRPELTAVLSNADRPEVRFLDYDWSLNERGPAP